jgi:hypothetical protein
MGREILQVRENLVPEWREVGPRLSVPLPEEEDGLGSVWWHDKEDSARCYSIAKNEEEVIRAEAPHLHLMSRNLEVEGKVIVDLCQRDQ